MKKKTITLAWVVAIGTFTNVQAQSQDANAVLQKADRRFFIENKGQWHSDVLYLCRMGGLDAWITKYGVNYTFYKIEKAPNATVRADEHRMPRDKFDREEHDNSILLGHRVLMKLQNANFNPSREGKQKQEGYYNYLIGNDPSKYASFVGLYKEAIVKDVYSGIDLRYYFDKGSLRYDFVVHPGADPSQIIFKLEGQNESYVKNGHLCFTTRFGEVQMAELKTYQAGDKKEVASHFKQAGRDMYGISVAHYDPTQTLIIDPLIYSTYIGGSADNRGYGIAIDASGNAYVTGYTESINYDITPGAFQTTFGGSWDVFVTKLNATGSGLVYSTYIGGSADDGGSAIAVDGSGNAYVTGSTSSTDYDITPGAFQTTFGGGIWDVFVTKLNATGSGLVYSTYIGGSDVDYGFGIAIDGSGNAYVTGSTYSTDYDITPGAFQTTYGGGSRDVFVTKLNATGSGLVYSTYIGGSSYDEGYGIAIDGSGNAYVTGYTGSTNYDITPGAFQTTFGGSWDVFVTKLNATGSGLVYSTYIGGSGYDEGRGIAIDGSGNAYVTGYTSSTNYDITPGAFQTTNGGIRDVFVTKLCLLSMYLSSSPGTDNQTVCINTAITNITYSTTGATGIGTPTGLPAGVTASWSSNVVTISGTPTVSGTFNYSIPLTGGCGNVSITGTITVNVCTGIQEQEEGLSWGIYPNPNNGRFVIQSERGGVFELMDVTGKHIQTYRMEGTVMEVNENLAAGVYIIVERQSGTRQKLLVK